MTQSIKNLKFPSLENNFKACREENNSDEKKENKWENKIVFNYYMKSG